MAEKEIEEYERELVHTIEFTGHLKIYCEGRAETYNAYVASLEYDEEQSSHINYDAANDEDAVEEAKQYFGVK